MIQNFMASLSLKVLVARQWVGNNLSNFCIYPTDIHLLAPHDITLTAYTDVHTDVGRC
jgi:hypothetical protein